MATSNFVARFADFSMLARIAKLGACDVWLVERTMPGRPPQCFTLYTLGADAQGSRSLAEALVTNGRRAMELEHASIARTLEVLTAEGDIGIVEARVHGRTLASIVAQIQRCNNSIPLWFSLHVAQRVCVALKYVSDRFDSQCSESSLHHFALGTTQISIAETGTVMLTGFGAGALDLQLNAAFTDNPLTALRPLALVSSPSLVDASKLDMLTVAGILYDLLTLGADEPSLVRRRTGAHDPSWSFVPPSHHSPWVPVAVDEILRRALDLECSDGFQDPEQLERALETYLQERWGRIEDADLAVFVNLLGRSEFDEPHCDHLDSAHGVFCADGERSPESTRLSVMPNTLPRYEEPCPVTRRADVLGYFASEAQGSGPSLLGTSREREPDTGIASHDGARTLPPARPESGDSAYSSTASGGSRTVTPMHDWAAAVASRSGGDVEGRVDIPREAAKERPLDEVHALFDRGLDCLRSGDLEGADAAWSKVLVLDPNHRASAANLKRLRQGRVRPK